MSRHLLALAALLVLATPASAETLAPQKILFVGNSITKHGPKADIDWRGNWGMAATSEDKDYVHVVTKALAAKQGIPPVIMVKNVADFERAHVGYDIAGKFADAAAFKADLVILCIGENVAALKTPEVQAKYQEQVTALLKTLKSNPQATIIVRSSFWANEAKDSAMRKACETVGGTFVDISALSKDEQNYARSERPYKHAGVANHPGDRGMAAIAEAIVKAVK
jgi:alpha-galactosidase